MRVSTRAKYFLLNKGLMANICIFAHAHAVFSCSDLVLHTDVQLTHVDIEVFFLPELPFHNFRAPTAKIEFKAFQNLGNNSLTFSWEHWLKFNCVDLAPQEWWVRSCFSKLTVSFGRFLML